jgi:endoglycosylceramidase
MRRTGALLALLVCLAAAGPANADPAAPLGHSGRWITDADGRVVILHGVNMVYKRAPYEPSAAGFGTDDAQFLQDNGFNVVRLGLIYKGVEPSPGAYDDAYLDDVAASEQTLADHGIFSLLDFHQDLYNERFQGEGFPDWAVQDDGLPALPQNGFPANYLLMPALNRAFDHFWANDAGPGGVGLQDRYAAAWKQTATRFADADHVLGYDLMNEPWPGTVFATCANPAGCPLFDTMQLTPFSNRVIAAIRSADPTTLAFYEPALTFDFGAQSAHGDTGDANAGFSFHDYCLPGAFGGPTGQTCATLEDLVYQNAEARSQATGDALLQTEFGATDDLDTIERVVNISDDHMVGWNYWHYCGCDDPTTQGPAAQAVVNDAALPPTGTNVREAKLAVLSRPYPQAVAGTPQDFGFDPATKRFQLAYSTARVDGNGSFTDAETEVFIPQIHYPDGYDVDVQGAAIASDLDARVLRLVACPGVAAVLVSVVPKGQGSGAGPDCEVSTGGGGESSAVGGGQAAATRVTVGTPRRKCAKRRPGRRRVCRPR